MAQPISSEQLATLVKTNRFVVVLFDAPWDIGPGKMVRRMLEEAERAYSSVVVFAEVNVDDEPEMVKELTVCNVPAVAYYRDGALAACLVSARQDIARRIDALMNNKPIRRGDGFDNAY